MVDRRWIKISGRKCAITTPLRLDFILSLAIIEALFKRRNRNALVTSIWRKVYLTAQEGAVHQEEPGASEEEESGAPDSPTFAEAELEDFLSVETPTIEEDLEFDRLFEEIYDRILSIFERENLILPPNPLSSMMDIVNFVLVDDSDMSELIYIYIWWLISKWNPVYIFQRVWLYLRPGNATFFLAWEGNSWRLREIRGILFCHPKRPLLLSEKGLALYWNRNEWNATEHSLSSGSARHSELWYRLLVYSAGPSCFGLISSGSWVLGISFHWLVQIQYGWCFQEEPFLAWCCNGTFW